MAEEYSLPEQVEAGASTHLPLEHPDAVDVAFGGAGAIGEGESVCGRHRDRSPGPGRTGAAAAGRPPWPRPLENFVAPLLAW